MEMIEQEKRKVKVKFYSGKILTITIKDQTDEYISGIDKDGVFVKVQLKDIEEAWPI